MPSPSTITVGPYVLVTPARNEQDFIELTIKSVVAQTLRPTKWVIVSDGSTDLTDEIVSKYAKQHEFIELVRTDPASPRDTAAKVAAIRVGIERIAPLDYVYIGNLDADLSFEPTYFATLIAHFEDDPQLGLAGGRIHQLEGNHLYEFTSSRESVAGAVQMFRRSCFEQIGGYRPIPGGMEDGIAEVSARYHGWSTRSIKGLAVVHHRPIGTVGRSIYLARFNNGMTEYVVGFGFCYHLARSLSRVFEKPFILGSLLLCFGYSWGVITRKPKLVEPDLIAYLRKEQWQRLTGGTLGRR